MPHELLGFEIDDTVGLLISSDLLTDYREAEKEAQEKEMKKPQKMKQGSARASKAKKKMPKRMANLGKKRK